MPFMDGHSQGVVSHGLAVFTCGCIAVTAQMVSSEAAVDPGADFRRFYFRSIYRVAVRFAVLVARPASPVLKIFVD
jgi:hypothetical protein